MIQDITRVEDNTMFNSASLILTERCNLRCDYCFEIDHHTSKDMSSDTAHRAIDMLVENVASEKSTENLREVHITFFGGEPLLMPQLISDILVYCNDIMIKRGDINFTFDLITNSTICDDDIIDLFNLWYDLYGTMNVQLSIDGDIESQSRRKCLNGKPSTELVEKTVSKYIEWAESRDIDPDSIFHTHSVVTRDSLDRLSDDFKYFYNLGIHGHWWLLMPGEMWTDSDVELYDNQIGSIVDFIHKCDNKELVYNKTSILSRYRSCHPNGPCQAGTKYCSIDPDGNIYACHRYKFNFPDQIIGNIFDSNNLDQRLLEKYQSITTDNMVGSSKCSECDATSCYRCMCENEELYGVASICNPDHCKMSVVERKYQVELAREFKNIDIEKSSINTISTSSADDIRKVSAAILDPIIDQLEANTIAISSIAKVVEQLTELTKTTINLILIDKGVPQSEIDGLLDES